MSTLDRVSGIRASDAERDQVAQILQAAVAEGRLSPEEGGERLAAAATARLREELARLITDLPGGERRLREESPLGRAAPRLGLVFRVARFAVVAALLVMLWGLSGARFFWPIWPLAFMALGLIAHARRARWAPHPPWRGSWRVAPRR